MFKAFVTIHWTGSGSSSWTYDQCYSSFTNSRNLIENNENNFFTTSTHVAQTSTRGPDNPLKGFYCFIHENSFFSSYYHYPKYWLIDLKEYKNIKSIVYIVPVRSGTYTLFSNIKFRLGNNSNYASNLLIHSFSEEALDRFPHKISLNPIINGRYLSIESSSTNYLALAAIQINEQ